MPGLGQRLLGAAMVGYGTGIVAEAKNRREETLLHLRRKWQVEDRDASAALTRQGWNRADERTDKTIAAADARADASVHPFIDDDGVTRYGRRGDVVDKRAPTKTATSEPLVKVQRGGKTVWLPRSQAVGKDAAATGKEERLYPIEDPRTGATIGYQTREEALGKTRGVDTADKNAQAEATAAEIADDMAGYLSSDEDDFGTSEKEFVGLLAGEIVKNPNVPPRTLAVQLAQRLKSQGGEAGIEQPPKEFPNARKAPDGQWYVPDPNSPSGWARVTN